MNVGRNAQRPKPGETVGVRAAWCYVCLAWHALLSPVLAQLPRHGTAMRAYLLYCVAAYGVSGSAFLLLLGKTTLPGTDPALTSPAAAVIWGVSALLVCLANCAALLIGGWRVWQWCSIATASWAGAFEVVLSYETGRGHGNIILLLFWGFFVLMHSLFISNKLVPIGSPSPLDEADPQSGIPDGAPALSPEEEEDLIRRIDLHLSRVPRFAVAGSAGAA